MLPRTLKKDEQPALSTVKKSGFTVIRTEKGDNRRYYAVFLYR